MRSPQQLQFVSHIALVFLSAVGLGAPPHAVAQTTRPAAEAATAELRPPAAPTVAGKAGIKAYLLSVLQDRCVKGSADFKLHAASYAKLIADFKGDYAAVAKARPKELHRLILAMRKDYQRIDSFGYEYVEGIVAGVPSMKRFDTELDAGVPAEGAGPDAAIANVKLKAGDVSIDREGSLNNFLIEPTVFGSNPRFVAATVDVADGSLPAPKAELVVALADYAVNGYDRLWKVASAWEPTTQDCFTAAAAMTPTLADYFDEWKESKLQGSASGGRFVAVSRVSDMEGIMSSTRLIWEGVSAEAAGRNAELAASISAGYRQILDFLNTIKQKESQAQASSQGAGPVGAGAATMPAGSTPAARPGLTVEQIDALGSQAKEMADSVHAKVVQAASLLKINLE